MVAKKLGRSCVGIDLNPEYLKLAHERIDGASHQPQLIAAEGLMLAHSTPQTGTHIHSAT